MIPLLASVACAFRCSRRGLCVGIVSLIAAFAVSGPLLAQDTPPAATGDTGAAAADTANGAGRQRRGNFSPEAAMAALKDRFAVADDSDWALIATRITGVMELRRSTAGGFGGGFRTGAASDTARVNRPGRAASPELDALRTAVTDNMPDAEIKARLDRYRAVRKQNEAKLEKAQEDLRAVLTVRQEALAVMLGLLP